MTQHEQTKMTMDEAYGDGSDHEVCPICGFCVTCFDCERFGCGPDPIRPTGMENFPELP